MAVEQTAKERYAELEPARTTIIDRAVECAELTLPYVIREDGADASTEYPDSYVRGFGAKLVSNLTGKLVPAILPTNQPFHRLTPSQEALSAVSRDNPDMIAEIYKIIAEKDEALFRAINKSKFRGVAYPLIEMAIVTGNGLVERNDDGSYRLFNLRSYVVKRSPNGKIVDLIIYETADYEALPDDVRNMIDERDKDTPVELHTQVKLVDGKYEYHQEANGELISGSEATLKSVDERFIVIAWNMLSGEDYGRGYVEKYLDTLKDLNTHLKVISSSAIVNSRTVLTVNPNGMTKYKEFVEAKNGDAIVGLAQDIGVVRTEKHNDLKLSYDIIQDYKRELSEAFLMSAGAVRDSERTTKYEVQVLMNELDGALGGIYTSLAEQIQKPLVMFAFKDIKLPETKEVDVDIISGAEALGKNIESLRIQDLLENLAGLAQIVGQEKIASTINTENVISSMVANSGVASKNLVYSAKEIQAKEAQQKQELMAQQALQGMIPQAGTNIANQLTGGQPNGNGM